MSNRELGKVEHVVFEFDVLADRQRTEVRAVGAAIDAYGRSSGDDILKIISRQTDDNDWRKLYATYGGSIPDLFMGLLEERLYPVDPREVEDQMLAHFMNHYADHYNFFATKGHNARNGALGLITGFYRATRAVASQTDEKEVESFLLRHSRAEPFTDDGGCIVAEQTIDEYGLQPFPQPDCLKFLAEEMDIAKSSDLVVVGSSLECFRAGRLFGAYVIGVALEHEKDAIKCLPADQAPDVTFSTLEYLVEQLPKAAA